MRSRNYLIVAVLTLMMSMVPMGSGQALAAGVTRWVNVSGAVLTPPGTGCDHPGYLHIQDAVNAAASGDTINVCPGTYPEQVNIATTAKNNITLRSTQPLAAVIQAPPVMADPGDIVRVNAAQDVSIREFTVTGPLPDSEFCSTFSRTGIRVDGGGSATIARNHITEIRSANPALRGCQNGIAILVGRTAEGQVGSATISGNLIDKYQKNGPTVDNVGSRATITNNVILGIGPTPVIAQNGIQISRGAVAEVRSNQVSDNTYSLAPADSASGILLFSPGAGAVIVGNDVLRNDDNIVLDTTSGAKINQNRTLDSTSVDGIDVTSTSTNNRITGNFLRRNKDVDCRDDSVGAATAGTANIWTDDNGVTQNKPGLCRPHGGDDGQSGDIGQQGGNDGQNGNGQQGNNDQGADHQHGSAD